jgi:hypothetical protein
MKRRDFISISLTLVMILSFIAMPPLMKSSQSVFAQPVAGGQRPNILLLLGDDFG